VSQERGRNRRERRVRGDRDDEWCEQGLVHDLQDDQDPECARRPDQMVVEAERGGVVFLHKSPFGLLGRKQSARHAIAERRGRYARNKSFADLLKACCQQP
jgi:hypothetical protein